MTTTKTEKFAWNETNAAEAIALYEAMLANPEQGLDYANTDGLTEIKNAVGANSPVQVRSKLVSAKVYQKADAPRKVGGGSSLRKAHYVRVMAKHAVADGLIEDADDLASLEQCKLETLDTLAKMLGIVDEVKASV